MESGSGAGSGASSSPSSCDSLSISAFHCGSFTVSMNTASAASIIPLTTAKKPKYGRNVFFIALFAKANPIPSTSTVIPPTVPMRLIIALALERSGFTVTSGMSATAGERKIDIDISTIMSMIMNQISEDGSLRVI